MLVFKVQEVNPKHCGLVVEMAGEPTSGQGRVVT